MVFEIAEVDLKVEIRIFDKGRNFDIIRKKFSG